MGYKLLSGFENEFVLYNQDEKGSRTPIYPELGYLLTSSLAKAVSNQHRKVFQIYSYTMEGP